MYISLHPYESLDPPIEVFDSVFFWQGSFGSRFLQYIYIYNMRSHDSYNIYIYTHKTTIDLKSHDS